MSEEEWELRFTIEPERSADLVELYRSSGHEVKVTPVTPDDLDPVGPQCADCVETACTQYVALYTRARS